MKKTAKTFKAAGAATIGARQTPEMTSNLPSPARFRSRTGFGSLGFDPMHREAFLDVSVTHLQNDYVCLSVAIPSDLVRGFVLFLESMGGLIRTADRYTKRVMREAQPVDLDAEKAKDQYREQFEMQIENIFDQFVAQGTPARDAIKATNKAMKARQHPWANYETIRRILSSRGKLCGWNKKTSIRKKSQTSGNSATP
jgi:hypothetical protein